MENVKRSWTRLETWLAARSGTLDIELNPPATLAAVESVERAIGTRLPGAVRASYLLHDGQRSGAGLFFGWAWAPLHELDRDWATWKELRESAESAELEEFAGEQGTSVPEGAIKIGYSNAGWIPLFNDGGGNHLGCDLDPGPSGVAGQIISFGRDEEEKRRLAETFDAFLEGFVGELERDNYEIVPPPDGPQLRARVRPPNWP